MKTYGKALVSCFLLCALLPAFPIFFGLFFYEDLQWWRFVLQPLGQLVAFTWVYCGFILLEKIWF